MTGDKNNDGIIVSISCITYNHAPYIRQCLDGFLMQKTDFAFEVLIHDDASTDGTEEIIRKYEAKYPDIIKPLYEEENQWVKGRKGSKTFNYPRAKGKYIALCEGDDYWTDPLKLQKQVDFLEKNPDYSMCFHNARVTYENSQKESHLFKELETRTYTGEEILQEWTIPTASVLFRKESYFPLNNPNFLYGDIILFLSLAENGKIWGMDDVMCIYRKHEGGLILSNKRTPDSLKKFIKHHEEISKSFGGKYKAVEDILLSKNYIGLSKKQFKNLDLNFLNSLFIAYKYKPKYFIKHLFRI